MAGKRGTWAAVLAGIAALLIPAAGSARSQAAPANSGEPRVSGPNIQGETLTTTNGTWTGSPTSFQYRWLRCDTSGGGVNGVNCATISGETRKAYVLSSADVGHRIRSRVIASNADGTGSANSNATEVVKASSTAGRPVNANPPTISGTAQEGQALGANRGTWTGGQPQSYSYQWRRCDANGGGCADIAGATGSTFVPKAADIGHTLRVRVTAKNSRGSTAATSTPTAVVRKAGVPAGNAIAIADVALPNRLIIDRVSFSPFILRSRQSVVARFRVSDTQGHPVVGALVFVVGIPFGNMTTPSEQATGPDGYVTFVVKPTARLKLRATSSQPFFVRARKAGDRLIGGVSTRRLVNLSIRRR
jgi:hypothetical protein